MCKTAAETTVLTIVNRLLQFENSNYHWLLKSLNLIHCNQWWENTFSTVNTPWSKAWMHPWFIGKLVLGHWSNLAWQSSHITTTCTGKVLGGNQTQAAQMIVCLLSQSANQSVNGW